MDTTAMMLDAPLFPLPRRHPLHPPAEYAQFRRRAALCPIRLWDGHPAWIATRYADVQALLTDPRFSQRPEHPGYPYPSENRARMLRGERPPVNSLDPPEHTRIRRMLAPMFRAGGIEALRGRVQELVDGLLDGLVERGPPADFVADFALALPSFVISDLLGVPYEDHAFFQSCAKARFGHGGDPAGPLRAGERMWEYLTGLIDRSIAEGTRTDTVIGRLACEHVRKGQLDRDEAIANVRQLLLAGHDTTTNMIALGTLLLLLHPEQKEALVADPSLVADAVEEMLRYASIAHFNSPRVAMEDMEIGGQRVRAGEGVVASIAAANRDPSVFPDPDRFDIRRTPNHHLAFTHGVHQCLGQPLARLELHVVFTSLFQRLPGLALAVPFEELPFTGNDQQAYGLYAMPVRW